MYFLSEKTKNNKGPLISDLEKTACNLGFIVEYFPMRSLDSIMLELKKGKYIAINDSLSPKVKRYKLAYEISKYLSRSNSSRLKVALNTQKLLVDKFVLLHYYNLGYTIDKLSDLFFIPKNLILNIIKETRS